MKYAFISRHEPTVELVSVGDRDAFTCDLFDLVDYDGAVVVHPALALRLSAQDVNIGVYENQQRAAAGEKPTFHAVALYLYTPGTIYKYTLDQPCPI